MKRYKKVRAKEVIAENMKNTAYQNDWNGSSFDAPMTVDQMRAALLIKGFGWAEAETIIASLVLAGAHFYINE